MWKNNVQWDRPQMTIWRMRIAFCIHKATDTHSEYVILIRLPLQQWLHERVSMLRYTYTVRLLNLRTSNIMWSTHVRTPLSLEKPPAPPPQYPLNKILAGTKYRSGRFRENKNPVPAGKWAEIPRPFSPESSHNIDTRQLIKNYHRKTQTDFQSVYIQPTAASCCVSLAAVMKGN